MSRPRILRTVVLGLLVALAATWSPTFAMAAETPTVTFTLLTELPTSLAVGETAVIEVRVESSEPFLMAIALSDAYYPGRGVRFDGSAASPQATSVDLSLTITGTASTADLPAVQDWPGEEDWPAGVAPLAVRVGARFPGGVVIGETFLFSVAVA